MIFTPETRPVVGPARIRWDDPPCPLCGGDRRSGVLEAPDWTPGGPGLRFAVVRCEQCGLHFTSPRPDSATIGQFYPRDARLGRLPDVAAGPLTLINVLEHAYDPCAVLAEARRLLGPGGRLTVTVPNLDSMAFRWLGPAWVGLDLPRHLTHFTPPTLRRMLERAGLRVIGVRQVPRADWVRSSAARIAQPSPLYRALTLKWLARLAAWACYIAGKSDELTVTAEVG
jgi:hypothetical protein